MLLRSGIATVSMLCLEEMLGNGQCDAACNNRECNYDSVSVKEGNATEKVSFDCTPTQIRNRCILAQEQSAEDLATVPAEPVPVAFTLQLGAGRRARHLSLKQRHCPAVCRLWRMSLTCACACACSLGFPFGSVRQQRCESDDMAAGDHIHVAMVGRALV